MEAVIVSRRPVLPVETWAAAAASGFVLGGLSAWRFLAARTARVHTQLRDASAALAGLRLDLRTAEKERERTVGILESMTEGVLVVDTRQKVLVINPALSRSLGIDKSQAEELHFWEVIRDADLNEAISGVLSRREAVNMEHAILLSGATFEIRISPVFQGAEFLGAVAVFYDVTKLKELERSRSEFVANVSHELKTPLTSILGFIETLKEGAIDDAENRMKFLGIIQDHSMKLHRLIEDLLVLSRIESGSRTLESETLDLGVLLGDALGLFGQALRAKGICLERKFDPDPFWFKADSKAMEEILSNLIDNAIKYNEPGGRITVRASREPEGVRLEVDDTGIGIPEAELTRVFERFYRVDKSRSRESGGTGLGLSIVKRLVERHRGRVEARRSASGKGTTFVITLPA